MPTAAFGLDADATVLAANDQDVAVFRTNDLIGASVERCMLLAGMLGHCAERSEARLAGWRANGVPVVLDVSVRHDRAGADRHTLCIVRELNHGALAHEAQRYFDVAWDILAGRCDTHQCEKRSSAPRRSARRRTSRPGGSSGR